MGAMRKQIIQVEAELREMPPDKIPAPLKCPFCSRLLSMPLPGMGLNGSPILYCPDCKRVYILAPKGAIV